MSDLLRRIYYEVSFLVNPVLCIFDPVATKTKTPALRVIIFERLDEDMPLFVELFCPHAKECTTLEALYSSIENPSFFSEKDPIYVRVDTLPKKIRWDLLRDSDVGVTLFFSKSLKDADGVECHNFSTEKPWERQKRLYQWIAHFCQKQKKTLHKGAFDRLFRISEGFGLAILRHVEQILLTLEAPQITLETLEKHHLYETEPNDWEKAKELLFRPRHSLCPDPLDILGFISKLRQEVYYNLFCFEDSPKVAIPPFRKKEMGEKKNEREALGINFFYAMLPLLLEVEMLAKSGSFSQEMLYDLLYTRIVKATPALEEN
jgi:hypothetical protein